MNSDVVISMLPDFLIEYIQNVYGMDEKLIKNNQLLCVTVKAKTGFKFELKFSPLEIIILLDNLLNNSQKSGAMNVIITLKSSYPGELEMSFLDDGAGIPAERINKVFEFGYSTTGIGLHHVKQIIEALKGKISINHNYKKGVEFIVKFQK